MKKRFSLDKFWSYITFDKKNLTAPGTIHEVKKELHESEKKKEDAKRKQEAEEQRKLIAKDLKMDEKSQQPEPTIEPILKSKKPVRRRRFIKELLILGGVDIEQTVLLKRLFQAALTVMFVLTAFSLLVTVVLNNNFETLYQVGTYIGFIAALWTVGFVGVFMLCAACFAVYLDLRINKRRKEIEEVFPDFLQLAAANLAAGMTIDRALWSAVRPRFGVLAKEIEDVAKKTMTGYDLERALQEFSGKYDSLVLKRSINLITEGIHSGGKMADILNKIAVNLQENAILQKEMAANVTTYIIFISFATVAAAPGLFGLATQLLIVIKSIAGAIGSQGGNGVGLSINPNVVSTADFRIYAIAILSVTSLMSACIVSVIRKGTIKDGFRLLPFFLATTISLYFLASWVLGFVFSGLV